MRKITKLEFLGEMDRRIIKIKHLNDIKIFIQNRENHQEFYDTDNNLVDIHIDYIVILIPKDKVNLENIKMGFKSMKRTEMLSTGFQIKKLEDFYEISGYNKVFFSWWIIPKLKSIKFANKKDFVVTSEFVLPLEKGEMGYYANPKGLQVGCNFLGFTVELLYLLLLRLRNVFNRRRKTTYDN